MIQIFEGLIPNDPSPSPVPHKIFVLCENGDEYTYTVCTSNGNSAIARTRNDSDRLVTLTPEEERHLFNYPKNGTYTNVTIRTTSKEEAKLHDWKKIPKKLMSVAFCERLYVAIMNSKRESKTTKQLIVPKDIFDREIAKQNSR